MIYDISPLISPATPVWPTDTPLGRELLSSREKGDPCTVSTLRTTVHIGAHADAPCHFGAGREGIDAVDLTRYLGPCQLLRRPLEGDALLTPEMLPRTIEAPRVLFATSSYHGNPQAPFAAIAAETIDALSHQGVCLVGLDTPSVDPANATTFPAHLGCLAAGMAILEGLVLDAVAEGCYELIALPLRLAGFDASPVRAVLRPLGSLRNEEARMSTTSQ